MAAWMSSRELVMNLGRWLGLSPASSGSALVAVAPRRRLVGSPLRCTPLQQAGEDAGIMCEPCTGRGWLLCNFCKGQKINVKSESNRIYRRCPSCRAVGYIVCTKCKVFKCVTFPDFDDGDLATP